MDDAMPRPSSRRLDPYGRITIHPSYRHILDGPVEQHETEEGILLRPAPTPRRIAQVPHATAADVTPTPASST